MIFLTLTLFLIHIMSETISLDWSDDSCEDDVCLLSVDKCRRRDRDCSSAIKEIQTIIKILSTNIKCITEESIHSLLAEIVDSIRNSGISHSIQSDIDKLVCEVKRCLKEYHSNDIKELTSISQTYSDVLVKETEKLCASSIDNINKYFDEILILPDDEILKLIKTNQLRSSITREVNTLCTNTSESIRSNIAKMSVVQQKSVGELNFKRIHCILSAIMNMDIKKTVMDGILGIIETIKGRIVNKILRILDIRINMQLLVDSIAIVSKIREYVKCVTGESNTDEGDLTILTSVFQNNLRINE